MSMPLLLTRRRDGPRQRLYIGGVYVDVAPGSSSDAVISWTPLPGPTHRCMLARCSLVVPPESHSNPTLFDVANERHVAQCNLHVVPFLMEIFDRHVADGS